MPDSIPTRRFIDRFWAKRDLRPRRSELLRPLCAMVLAGVASADQVLFHFGQVALFALEHLFAIGRLSVAALICGYRMNAHLHDADSLERALASIALGLGSIATLITALGIAHLLYPVVVLTAISIVIVACALANLREVINQTVRWWQGSANFSRHLLIGAALTVALAPMVILALYPPTAFDATLYHLPYAKLFVASHRLVFASQLRYPIFPQLNEMLFTAMLMATDDIGAQLVQTLAAIITAAILIAWGRRSSTPLAGWIAAALWLGNPIVVYLSATAYVECGLALWVTAALWASERWRQTDDTGWLILAAIFAGFAADAKYTGLIAPALVLALSFRRRSRGLRAFTIAAIVTMLVMFPWYARIVWLTGNPVFPFLARLFGENVWGFKGPALPPNFARLGAMPRWAASIVRGLGAPAIIAWNLTLNRNSFGDLPQVSPVYLLSLPALAMVPFWRKQTTALVIAVLLILWMLLFGLPPSTHYLVEIFPIWSLVIGYGCAIAIDAITSRRARFRIPTVVGLCVLFFIPGRIYADYRRARLGPVPTNDIERDAYLSEQLPVYPALLFLDRLHGNDYTVYGLFAENMTYFARGHFIGDWNGPANYSRLLGGIDNSCSLHDRLRQLGADYLVVPRANFPSVVPQDDCFQKCFAPAFADRGALSSRSSLDALVEVVAEDAADFESRGKPPALCLSANISALVGTAVVVVTQGDIQSHEIFRNCSGIHSEVQERWLTEA